MSSSPPAAAQRRRLLLLLVGFSAAICSVQVHGTFRRLPAEDLRPELQLSPTVAAAVADIRWRWRMLAEAEASQGAEDPASTNSTANDVDDGAQQRLPANLVRGGGGGGGGIPVS